MSVNRYFRPIIGIFEVCVLSPLARERKADSSSFAIVCLSIVRTTNSC